VILLRRGGKHAERGLQLLLVQRNAEARFMPGVWVFPGGAVDAADGEGDEGFRTCAARELQEETGLHAGKMTYLGPLFLAYGLMDQRMHTFLAEDLTQGEASPAPEEGDLVCTRVPIKDFEAGILDGRILDACSVAAYGLLRLRGLL
jgi:8-oxo-dGTP pyrophosphatase MutT (NUDIX family)